MEHDIKLGRNPTYLDDSYDLNRLVSGREERNARPERPFLILYHQRVSISVFIRFDLSHAMI